MKRFLFFIIIIGLSSKAFGQIEFKPKFKAIKPQTTIAKPKKEKDIPPPTNFAKLDLPKIVAPNVLKETNIFGTKPKPDNSFEIGTPENHFSMTPKNKFEHKLGDVYQDKMTKDLSKTMIREGLKEDKSLLDRVDRYLGEYRTKSEYFTVKYRDYIVIDGDLINVYLNGKLLRSGLYLNSEFGEFRIPLNLGLNDIEFVVASMGTSGGNTAELHVLDDVNRAIDIAYWNNLALGVKIKMIVIRE
ncbi:hypothetical protein FNW25_09750 [Flavobacterium franklandianum]|uniref:hypothetical protein n=1 Tax=Flavobacterium franklandianum TaxID=2594430 RepID=UPI00117A5822|nr:hypothetical protein [Flavobacterium franklandianum]TRX25053.1 hypothetical protein FNW25_09750 [Flavobacterium franklandianum]